MVTINCSGSLESSLIYCVIVIPVSEIIKYTGCYILSWKFPCVIYWKFPCVIYRLRPQFLAACFTEFNDLWQT